MLCLMGFIISYIVYIKAAIPSLILLFKENLDSFIVDKFWGQKFWGALFSVNLPTF